MSGENRILIILLLLHSGKVVFYENIQNSFARIGHGFICYKFLGYRLSGFMGKKQPVGLPSYIGCFHYRYFRTTDGQTGYKE